MALSRVLILQPPSPPYMNVKRDYAGGFGVADPSPRDTYGHDPDYIVLPYMSLLYSAAILKKEGHAVDFIDAQADRLTLVGLIEQISQINPSVIVSVLISLLSMVI